MKRISLQLIVIITATQVFGQGSLKVTPGASVKTINGSHIVLNNTSLVNNGTIQQAVNQGVFDFHGNSNNTISGSGNIQLDRINLAKNPGATLTLQRSISIGTELVFNGGLFNLDNYILDLDGSGVLTNESENSRAFTTGTGYVQATRILNSPASVNVGNLGAVISSSKNLGSTIIRRGHQVQPNIFGSNSSILRYYDIIPTNNISLKATLKFYYFDTELNGINEATLIQWKKKSATAWDYVGSDNKDAIADYVLKNNISKFTLWTLAADTVAVLVRTINSLPVNELASKEFIVKVIPNPTNQEFSITIQTSDEIEKIVLKVIDAAGRIVEVRNITANQTNIFGQNYRPGIYFSEVIQGKVRRTIKLIKQ
jgi:hypothetical protein